MPARTGTLAVGPMALLMMKQRNAIPIQSRSRGAASDSSTQIWRDLIGSIFLYTAANWGAVSFFLEAYYRSTSAKAMARLFDVTANAAVASSTLTLDAGLLGVLLIPTRIRSVALTLVDGHEYRIQYGVQDGGAGAAISAKLIAV
jgi:hypothetical protein